jgi:tRNA A37 threonylcarbamoyladenosine biosynthesis protein TsaE
LNRLPWLDQRPVIVGLAGPNGAGKTTFFHAHLEPAGLRFVNPTFWLVSSRSSLTLRRVQRTPCAKNW